MKHFALITLRLCLGLALAACRPALADDEPAAEGEVQTGAAMEVWAYLNSLSGTVGSQLNPGNAIARLPASQKLLDARANLQAKIDSTDFVLQPRLLAEHSAFPEGSDSSDGAAYLSQAFVRARPDQRLTLTGGRFRLAWGPANFRSPSNPFYFDSGKNQPLRDVPGLDLLRVDYTTQQAQLTAAYVAGAGHLAARPDIDDVFVLKADRRSADWMASAVATVRAGAKPFLGAFTQYTASDALMFYGEYGHGQRPVTLRLPGVASGAPAVSISPSESASSALAGASYTLLNGQVLSVEYLYDGHGYSYDEQERYFALAARNAQLFRDAPNATLRGEGAAALGQLISHAPALLGRHYGYLLWQSNPQESAFYWRAALSCNLQDGSAQALLYAEKNLSRRVSVFGSAMINHGRSETEFGAITAHALSVGAKFFIF